MSRYFEKAKNRLLGAAIATLGVATMAQISYNSLSSGAIHVGSKEACSAYVEDAKKPGMEGVKAAMNFFDNYCCLTHSKDWNEGPAKYFPDGYVCENMQESEEACSEYVENAGKIGSEGIKAKRNFFDNGCCSTHFKQWNNGPGMFLTKDERCE